MKYFLILALIFSLGCKDEEEFIAPTLQREKTVDPSKAKVEQYFKEEPVKESAHKEDFSDLKETESCSLDSKNKGLAGCSVQ